MYTPYHSLYWATALTLRGGGGDLSRLSQSIASARVDLNPDQVDTALIRRLCFRAGAWSER
jgi:hypothetical protein